MKTPAPSPPAKEKGIEHARMSAKSAAGAAASDPAAPQLEEDARVLLAKMLGFIPMGRMGEPDEIAQMALFLGSGRSSYMTGNVFEVAGGMGM